ncbi:hypothetical protein D3C81_1678750 [compost metagenome]
MSNRFDAVSCVRPLKPPMPALAVTLVHTYGSVKLEAKFHAPGPVSQTFITVASVKATLPSTPSAALPAIGTLRLPPIDPSR